MTGRELALLLALVGAVAFALSACGAAALSLVAGWTPDLEVTVTVLCAVAGACGIAATVLATRRDPS